MLIFIGESKDDLNRVSGQHDGIGIEIGFLK